MYWIKDAIDFFLNGIYSMLQAGFDLVAWLVASIVFLFKFGAAKIVEAGAFLWFHKFLTALVILMIALKYCPKVREFFQRSLIGMIQFILRLLGLSVMTDSIHLASGSHEIKIDLGRTPVNVWVTLDDQEALPVCQGNIDKVGVQLGDTFFVLYADISSSARSIRWLAVLN